jgi:hypothetical protein
MQGSEKEPISICLSDFPPKRSVKRFGSALRTRKSVAFLVGAILMAVAGGWANTGTMPQITGSGPYKLQPAW